MINSYYLKYFFIIFLKNYFFQFIFIFLCYYTNNKKSGGYYEKIYLFTIISMFGANAKEGLNNEITSKISFFMTKKQLEDAIKRTPVDSVDNKDTQIYVYTDVNDMLNKENKFSSFMFADDMLISSVFITPSTEAEHKSILNSYMNFFSLLSGVVLKKFI